MSSVRQNKQAVGRALALCHALLSEQGEVSGRRVAAYALWAYQSLSRVTLTLGSHIEGNSGGWMKVAPGSTSLIVSYNRPPNTPIPAGTLLKQVAGGQTAG